MITTIRFDPWPSPDDHTGFHARSDYVERCWTSAIGPTGVLALRAVALLLDTAAGPVTVEHAEFARSLGVGAATGRHAPMTRTLDRLDRFRLAYQLPGGYALRQWLPPMPASLIRRAPLTVQQIHARHIAELHGRPRPLASSTTNPSPKD
jgi:hypothetical protein